MHPARGRCEIVNFARIQHHIDKGLGIAGRHLGPPYAVHRIDATANGDYPDGWNNVANNVAVFVRRSTDRYIQSALLASGTLWLDVIGNMEPYLLGDVFRLTDAPYHAGVSYGLGATSVANVNRYSGFGLAWHAPVDEPVGARLDVRVQIFRTMDLADTNLGDGIATWRGSRYVSQPLVLTNGTYSFVDPYSGQQASFVPAGISSTDRPPRGHLIQPAIPGDMQVSRYFMYLPPLPGWIPTEGDRIVQESGQRYVVTNPYNQSTGVVGNQIGVDRRDTED